MTRRPAATPPVLTLGFRPFFLAVGAAGVALPLGWLAILHGAIPAPRWLDPFLWHGHEMLFGLVQAAIAGFLLTSVPVWTETTPVSGRPLAGLVGLWALGRLAMAAAGVLPPGAVAALDLAFPLALLVAVGAPIVRARALRQLGVAVALVGLVVANAAGHLDAMGRAPGAARPAFHAASVFVAVLILVIGGRIAPAFTRNAMHRVGAAGEVRVRAGLDVLAMGAALALAVAELLGASSLASGAARGLASGVLASVAAGAAALRMTGWQTRFALRDPLLASLHAGHAWVAFGFAALAAADLGVAIPRAIALHVLTAGAMGTMVLAVMTRVSLGHTGRPLVAPRSAIWAYVFVGAGALLRVVGPLLTSVSPLAAWTLAGALWASAFASFLYGYAPMLVRRRVDP